MRNHAIGSNAAIVINFNFTAITKIAVMVNSRNFTAFLKNVLATEYAKFVARRSK